MSPRVRPTSGLPMTLGHAEKRGFSTVEAGAYIGRSPSWLRKRRLRGANDPGDLGPRYRKTAGGSALYLKEDLDTWLNRLAEGPIVQADQRLAVR